jgi:catechol 2,3-dioxygenase-like lactoylglutathione lyase family enzyme
MIVPARGKEEAARFYERMFGFRTWRSTAGGRGVYFRDPSGHLLELLTRDYAPEQFART